QNASHRTHLTERISQNASLRTHLSERISQNAGSFHWLPLFWQKLRTITGCQKSVGLSLQTVLPNFAETVSEAISLQIPWCRLSTEQQVDDIQKDYPEKSVNVLGVVVAGVQF
ncbi:MAG: hypothetical protein OSA98_10490, partial [Rubripirellula sp.]|nr:hypothetical protein [Rubripirellula sp.]